MSDLSALRVAVLAADGFEEEELNGLVQPLMGAGAEIEILSIRPGYIQGFQGFSEGGCTSVDRPIGQSDPDAYDAVVLPGGIWSIDALRDHPPALDFLYAINEDARPIATLSHAPWLLISAGLVRGRTLTGASVRTVSPWNPAPVFGIVSLWGTMPGHSRPAPWFRLSPDQLHCVEAT